jgi:DNA repair protein RadC
MDKKERLMKYTKSQLVEMLVKENAIGISRPADALEPILEKLEALKFKEVECFVTITLNGGHKIIDTHIVSKGLVNQTIVHPREVFRPAIADNATAIIIAHNHPSGNLEPSAEDKGTTRRIKEAGNLLGIKVLDHLIVSPSARGYFSFLENDIF